MVKVDFDVGRGGDKNISKKPSGKKKHGALCAPIPHYPPWRQPRGKTMVSFVNSHTNATRIGWHPWEIDLRFAPGLPPGRIPPCERTSAAGRESHAGCLCMQAGADTVFLVQVPERGRSHVRPGVRRRRALQGPDRTQSPG